MRRALPVTGAVCSPWEHTWLQAAPQLKPGLETGIGLEAGITLQLCVHEATETRYQACQWTCIHWSFSSKLSLAQKRGAARRFCSSHKQQIRPNEPRPALISGGIFWDIGQGVHGHRLSVGHWHGGSGTSQLC